MLRSTNRVTLPHEFLKVRKYGRTIFGPFFNFSYLEKNKNAFGDLDLARFGFITPASLDKRSTVRNRVKRLVREAVRLYIKEPSLGGIKNGLLGVFVIRRGAVGKTYEEISQAVDSVLSKVFKPQRLFVQNTSPGG